MALNNINLFSHSSQGVGQKSARVASFWALLPLVMLATLDLHWLMEATPWSLQVSSYSPPLVCLCPNALLKKTLVFELGPTQSVILTNYICKDSVC